MNETAPVQKQDIDDLGTTLRSILYELQQIRSSLALWSGRK